MAEPFFFGPQNERIFGVYDAPTTSADRDTAVVICAPLGREYVLAHRALRQLALRLARVGFHVLRFDYRGCGDSFGQPDVQDLDGWAADVGAAADALLDRSGLDRVALAGLRLGGTLALLGARRRGDVDALVLWEPVLDGPVHVAELVAAGGAERRKKDMEDAPVGGGVIDVLGWPMGPALRQSLERMALAFERRPARRVLLLRDAPHAEDAALLASLATFGVAAERREIGRKRIWIEEDDEAESRALVPSQTLEMAVEWLIRRGR